MFQSVTREKIKKNCSAGVKYVFLKTSRAVKRPQDVKCSLLTSTVGKGKIVFIEFNLFEDCILLLQVLLHCNKSDTLGQFYLEIFKVKLS